MARPLRTLLCIVGQTSYEQQRRKFTVDGRCISVCVSQECWAALEDICCQQGLDLETLVAGIARRNHRRSLSTALDLFAIAYFQAACRPAGGLCDVEAANLLPC